MFQIKDLIHRELDPTEKLLWAGMPQQGIYLKASDAGMIPFSIMWGGFAIFWEYSVLSAGAPLLFKIWGIPFVLVGLYMIFGRFIYDSRLRSKTYYGVTEKRIIILKNLMNKSVVSIPFSTLSDISFKEGKEGKGSIMLPGSGKSKPELERIKNARDVYNLIRQNSESN